MSPKVLIGTIGLIGGTGITSIVMLSKPKNHHHKDSEKDWRNNQYESYYQRVEDKPNLAIPII